MCEQKMRKQLLPNIIHYHYIYHFQAGIIQEETVKLVAFFGRLWIQMVCASTDVM